MPIHDASKMYSKINNYLYIKETKFCDLVCDFGKYTVTCKICAIPFDRQMVFESSDYHPVVNYLQNTSPYT